MKKRSKKRLARFCIILILFSCLQGLFFIHPQQTKSANLTSVSDLLSTSRLSYFGRESGTLAGSSIVKINTSGNAPDKSTANLFSGDTVLIGDSATATTYTIDDILDSDEIQLTGAIGADDDDNADVVIATRSASHTIELTTASAIANGAFRIRVKADTTQTANDGIPDPAGFDFGAASTPTVTCPDDVDDPAGAPAEFDFVAGTATASGESGCAAGYHCFECRYSGTGNTTTNGSNQPFQSANNRFVIDSLINPAPSSSHTAGTADTYTIIVDHLSGPDSPSPYSVVDSTSIKIAVVESVRVTAKIEPSITFTISGVASGQTRCNVSTKATSTATTVPFGALTLGQFNDMAQQLSCVTNALNGYAVTMISDDQLSIGAEHSTEIPNTDCDSENCTDTTSAEWNTENDSSGLGFSIENIDATTVPFEWSTATGLCSGAYCARMIPSTATAGESGTTDDSDTALSIMSNTSTPSTTEDIYVCYRLTASTVQPAGDYENQITYVATATF